MKCIIFQIDDRGDFLQISSYNKKYADKYDYDYKFYTNYIDIPVFWQKVYISYDLLSKYDIVMLLDSDAFIHNTNKPLEYYLGNKFFTFSSDVFSKFNAGAFIIKSNEITKKMFAEWLSYYDESKWYKKNGKYKTNYIWAGDAYEQGTFVKYIYNNFLPYSNILEEYIFQCNKVNDIKEETFVIHFYGNKKEIKVKEYKQKFPL